MTKTDLPRDMDEWERNREIADAGRPLIQENKRLREVLLAVDCTLLAHGKVDANTPLHERIQAVLSET